MAATVKLDGHVQPKAGWIEQPARKGCEPVGDDRRYGKGAGVEGHGPSGPNRDSRPEPPGGPVDAREHDNGVDEGVPDIREDVRPRRAAQKNVGDKKAYEDANTDDEESPAENVAGLGKRVGYRADGHGQSRTGPEILVRGYLEAAANCRR